MHWNYLVMLFFKLHSKIVAAHNLLEGFSGMPISPACGTNTFYKVKFYQTDLAFDSLKMVAGFCMVECH